MPMMLSKFEFTSILAICLLGKKNNNKKATNPQINPQIQKIPPDMIVQQILWEEIPAPS